MAESSNKSYLKEIYQALSLEERQIVILSEYYRLLEIKKDDDEIQFQLMAFHHEIIVNLQGFEECKKTFEKWKAEGRILEAKAK